VPHAPCAQCPASAADACGWLQFLVLLVIKGLFMALCCLKAFNWDEILRGKSSGQPGGAGGADPSVQPFVPLRANEHTPLAKVL
jgi:hypothetical protein